MKSVLEKTFAPTTSFMLLRMLHFFTTGLFGTGFGVASKVIMPLVRNQDIEVRYNDDSKFTFRLNDNYWNRLAFKGYVYEGEMEYFLHEVRGIDYVFLDCGANLGYWSILVSSELLGSKEVVSIEASPTTFKVLSENCFKNQNRFIVLNNALHSSAGREFLIDSTESHAAAFIKEASDNGSGGVESITLDLIHGEFVKDRKLPVIVKLDVEGQEINALRGAPQLLENDVLLIYEDHAHDVDHEVTAFVLSQLGMSVFYIDENCNIVEINNLDMLEKIKVLATKGYNFFACKADSCFFPYFVSA